MAVAGLIVGAIGLVVSAAALVVAVWQIRKTQSAAERAAQAATEARAAVYFVASISDLSQITIQMDLIRELHRNGEWVRAIDRYISLRRLLTEASARLPQEARNTSNVAIMRLRQMEMNMNDALTQSRTISAGNLNNELVEIQQSLDEIRVWLENRLSGELNAGGQ